MFATLHGQFGVLFAAFRFIQKCPSHDLRVFNANCMCMYAVYAPLIFVSPADFSVQLFQFRIGAVACCQVCFLSPDNSVKVLVELWQSRSTMSTALNFNLLENFFPKIQHLGLKITI